MNLLGSVLYDPAGAVSKSLASLLAMTALDTTNLRLAITVPAHGVVRFRLRGVIHGATGVVALLLGVMQGATVVGRMAPAQGNINNAAALNMVEAEFTVRGLTPGAANFDAAYGVETVIASLSIKYGGPDNTTGNDAFGGFLFEAWDPVPMPANFTALSIDANGRVDAIKIAGTTQTARDLGATLGVAGAGLTALGDTRVANLDAAVSSRLASASYTAPDNATISQIASDLPSRITKNVALAAFPFFMSDSTDHVSGKTGLTVTAQRSIDGAAFAACANAPAEVSAGWYKIDLAATDLNGNTIALKWTASGADPTNMTIVTEPT